MSKKERHFFGGRIDKAVYDEFVENINKDKANGIVAPSSSISWAVENLMRENNAKRRAG
jgi:hypothetical protein